MSCHNVGRGLFLAMLNEVTDMQDLTTSRRPEKTTILSLEELIRAWRTTKT